MPPGKIWRRARAEFSAAFDFADLVQIPASMIWKDLSFGRDYLYHAPQEPHRLSALRHLAARGCH